MTWNSLTRQNPLWQGGETSRWGHQTNSRQVRNKRRLKTGKIKSKLMCGLKLQQRANVLQRAGKERIKIGLENLLVKQYRFFDRQNPPLPMEKKFNSQKHFKSTQKTCWVKKQPNIDHIAGYYWTEHALGWFDIAAGLGDFYRDCDHLAHTLSENNYIAGLNLTKILSYSMHANTIQMELKRNNCILIKLWQ